MLSMVNPFWYFFSGTFLNRCFLSQFPLLIGRKHWPIRIVSKIFASSSCFIFIISLLGWSGAYKHHLGLLKFYLSFCIIVFATQLLLSIFSLAYTTQILPYFTNAMYTALNGMTHIFLFTLKGQALTVGVMKIDINIDFSNFATNIGRIWFYASRIILLWCRKFNWLDEFNNLVEPNYGNHHVSLDI